MLHKGKNDKLGCIKFLKNFMKRAIKRVKGKATEWEKIFEICMLTNDSYPEHVNDSYKSIGKSQGGKKGQKT